jgi:hypothetical protein
MSLETGPSWRTSARGFPKVDAYEEVMRRNSFLRSSRARGVATGGDLPQLIENIKQEAKDVIAWAEQAKKIAESLQ